MPLSQQYLEENIDSHLKSLDLKTDTLENLRLGRDDFQDWGGAIIGSRTWVAHAVAKRLVLLQATSLDCKPCKDYGWQRSKLEHFCARVQSMRTDGTLAAGYIGRIGEDRYGAFGFGFPQGEVVQQQDADNPIAPPAKAADKPATTPQPATKPEPRVDMKQLVWSVVSPLQTTLQDPNKIIALGPDCIPAVIDVFLHPKEPSTGIACNQAVLACVLGIFAHKGNQDAATFLRHIANDDVDLFDAWGQTAYEMAKQFVSDHPLVDADKAKSPAPSTKSFHPTYPEWMVVPDNAKSFIIDSDCEVLPWETFACPKCLNRFGNLPSNGPGVKYLFNYGMRGIAGGAAQQFAKVWWTEVRCCGQKYLVSNRGS